MPSPLPNKHDAEMEACFSPEEAKRLKWSAFGRKFLPILLLFVLVYGLFALIFWIGDLPRHLYILVLEIGAFILAIVFFVVLALTKKEYSLQEQVRGLDKALQVQSETARRENQDLQAYFLTWVHQMKTPITAAQMITRRYANEKGMTEVRLELLEIENYTNMAMSYLKLFSPEADMVLCPTPIDDLMKPLLKKYALLFSQQGNSLEYEPDPAYVVVTDERWASLMIEQILSNAVKYTSQGTIGIAFDPGSHTLTIADTGPGIAASDLPKIFQRGYSGFNGRLNQKSSGLGLFLAQGIAEKLAVKIYVSSQLGQGSTFGLVFPPPMN